MAGFVRPWVGRLLAATKRSPEPIRRGSWTLTRHSVSTSGTRPPARTAGCGEQRGEDRDRRLRRTPSRAADPDGQWTSGDARGLSTSRPEASTRAPGPASTATTSDPRFAPRSSGSRRRSPADAAPPSCSPRRAAGNTGFLGRSGRLLHRRDRRRRCVARRQRRRHRRLVPRTPACPTAARTAGGSRARRDRRFARRSSSSRGCSSTTPRPKDTDATRAPSTPPRRPSAASSPRRLSTGEPVGTVGGPVRPIRPLGPTACSMRPSTSARPRRWTA